MKKFEFFDHTADAMFRAYGKTLEEAFVNAAKATYTLVTDIKKVKRKKEYSIDIVSKKKESLLFDFMDKLIFLTDTKGFLLADVKKLSIQDAASGHSQKGAQKKRPMEKLGIQYRLRAIVVGDSGDAYEIKTQIKAPTYSDMLIKEEKGKVMVQMVHDI